MCITVDKERTPYQSQYYTSTSTTSYKSDMRRKQAVSNTITLYKYKPIPNEQDHFCTLPLKKFHCDSPFTPYKNTKGGMILHNTLNKWLLITSKRLESFNDQKDCKCVIIRCIKTHQTPASFNPFMIQDYTNTQPSKVSEIEYTTLCKSRDGDNKGFSSVAHMADTSPFFRNTNMTFALKIFFIWECTW